MTNNQAILNSILGRPGITTTDALITIATVLVRRAESDRMHLTPKRALTLTIGQAIGRAGDLLQAGDAARADAFAELCRRYECPLP